MPFPQRSLGEDESVVLDLHPHWKRLIIPALLLPVVAGVTSFAVFLIRSGREQTPLRWAVVVVALVLLLRFSVWPLLVWRATRYVLTTKRIILRSGVFSRSGRDIPLSRVNDVSFRRTFVERLLGCGTLTVESAGEHGQVVLPEVPDVERVQREIYRCAEDDQRRTSGQPEHAGG